MKLVKQSVWLKFRKDYLKDKADFAGYYRCVHCGRSVRDIEVDHIKRRGSHPELALDTNNLQLLCHSCHWKKDNGQKVVYRPET